MPALQRKATWTKERLLGDLRQSVPQNGRVHLHIIEWTFLKRPLCKKTPFPNPTLEVPWGRFGGQSMQNVWGEENVAENTLSRKFLHPSKRACGLLFRGILYWKNSWVFWGPALNVSQIQAD